MLLNGVFLSKYIHGKIYLIKAKGFNWYKIGKSRKTSKRLRWLYTNLPFEVELIHTIETDSIDTLERYFHKLFKTKRLKGEWFNLDEADIGMFKGYIGPNLSLSTGKTEEMIMKLRKGETIYHLDVEIPHG